MHHNDTKITLTTGWGVWICYYGDQEHELKSQHSALVCLRPAPQSLCKHIQTSGNIHAHTNHTLSLIHSYTWECIRDSSHKHKFSCSYKQILTILFPFYPQPQKFVSPFCSVIRLSCPTHTLSLYLFPFSLSFKHSQSIQMFACNKPAILTVTFEGF